jgi:hypothetical protein
MAVNVLAVLISHFGFSPSHPLSLVNQLRWQSMEIAQGKGLRMRREICGKAI